MPRTHKEEPHWVEATIAFVAIIGARAPEWRKEVVRDRHTGKLAEVPLTEYPPIDPGDEGRSIAVRKGERFMSDDEVVLWKPDLFRPVPEGASAA